MFKNMAHYHSEQQQREGEVWGPRTSLYRWDRGCSGRDICKAQDCISGPGWRRSERTFHLPPLVHGWGSQPKPSRVKGAPKATQQVRLEFGHSAVRRWGAVKATFPSWVPCLLLRVHPPPRTSLTPAQTPLRTTASGGQGPHVGLERTRSSAGKSCPPSRDVHVPTLEPPHVLPHAAKETLQTWLRYGW